MLLLDALEEREPRGTRHPDVRHEHLRCVPLERGERVLGEAEGLVGDPLARERLLEHPTDGAVVVDDPDRFHGIGFTLRSGRTMRNTVRPGRLSHSIRPRCCCTYACANVRPRPVPPSRPDTSGWNIRSRSSGGTPGPLSTTCNSSARECRCRAIVAERAMRVRKTISPRGASSGRGPPSTAWAAFRTMLRIAWISCSRSPSISGRLAS